MPSVSKKQHNLMAMVAHDPKAAKRLGIPQSVGQEFVSADKGKKFGSGGRPTLQKINRPKTNHGQSAIFKEGGEMKTKKMMDGGTAGLPPQAAARAAQALAARRTLPTQAQGARPFKKGGVATTGMGKVTAGGKRAFGEHTVQQKGHTKGKQVAMKKGGKC